MNKEELGIEKAKLIQKVERKLNEFVVLNRLNKEINDLIDQLDEPELPVIPKFVADWIEDKKITRKGSPITAIFLLYENQEPYNVCVWVVLNQEEFMEAYTNDYIVEQEKRYRLKLNAPILIDSDEVFLNVRKGKNDYFIRDTEDTCFVKTIFTESELSQIDETGFVRVEVKK